MVEIDLTNVIIPLIVGIVVPFVIIFLSKFGKTQEGTLTGTIRIEGLKNNIDEARETMDRGFEKIEKMLNQRDTEMRIEFSKVNRELQDLTQKLMLDSYRIDRLEKDRGWQGGTDNLNRRKRDIQGE